jgi:hypothetical protein
MISLRDLAKKYDVAYGTIRDHWNKGAFPAEKCSTAPYGFQKEYKFLDEDYFVEYLRRARAGELGRR